MKNPEKVHVGWLTLLVASVAITDGVLIASGPAVAAPSPVASRSRVHTASDGEAPPAALIGPNGEKPVKWGVATFDEGSGPLARVSVGGGTWNYGTSKDGLYKKCYSNYIHTTKKHSASVAIGSKTNKDVKGPDVWANASSTNGWGYKCNAYWGIY
ncbi:lactococcin 972 family bacteriocin [Streptomyces sp. VTCC 41912]|uniref:lactococcin 972 family bacteriocin n=1 Tax=Streptomyces sp. VTCC 41912 TaxID=3383243 RepID=UPI003896D385